MIEAGAPSTGSCDSSRVCPVSGGSHVRTTRALALLMLVRIPLENTKRPEPRTPGGVGAPTRLIERSGRNGGGRPRPDYSDYRP